MFNFFNGLGSKLKIINSNKETIISQMVWNDKNKLFFEFSWKVKKIDFKTKIYFSLSLFNISEGGGFEKKKKMSG